MKYLRPKKKTKTKKTLTKEKSSTVISEKKTEDFNWLEQNMMSDLERDESLQDLLKATESDEKLKELAETVGGVFLNEQCIDYEQIHADLIKNKLIPLCNEYIQKYGTQWINREFILSECIQLCLNFSPKRKVIHVEMCIEFIKYLSSFHTETVKFKNLKRMFFLKNYPVVDLQHYNHVVCSVDRTWKSNEKYFKYKMGYKLQRIASLAACFESINEELIKKFKAFNNKSRIDIMTDNFIQQEIEDPDFQRIDQYWDTTPISEIEDLNNLGSIDLQEWKLIEDTLK